MLVVIIVAALCVVLVGLYTNVFQNLFVEPKVIEYGDCVNVSYIGRYASNNTVFDSSYSDWKNKTGDSPLHIFVTTNTTATPPSGYSQYTSSYIPGLIEGLKDLKEGQTTVITVPPNKGYGERRLMVGDTFQTKSLVFGFTDNTTWNLTVVVTGITDDNVTLQWTDVTNRGNFTMPEGVLMKDLASAVFSIYEPFPPYYIWKNSSQIISTTNESILIQTTPTAAVNITDAVQFATVGDKMSFILPDVTTATWNDTKITIHTVPVKGTLYAFNYQGVLFNITIDNVTSTHFNVTIEMGGQIQPLELNTSLEFNRTVEMQRVFVIPTTFIQYTIAPDLQAKGYSVNKLAGETLLFEVTIDKVYKTSQQTS